MYFLENYLIFQKKKTKNFKLHIFIVLNIHENFSVDLELFTIWFMRIFWS